ncbi:MAG: transporter substrate-binding domain-containing protein [Pseudomonadota bacterium]|nr:transporter substrate-binding domain-containing protein [Pseudomonadota bacterium]
MPLKFFLLPLFLVLTLALPVAAQEKKESVYDRVMRTGTIRCGYFSWYPAVIKDPVTGEFKGIVYEYMSALGRALNLKIDWVEEIGLGDYPAALESGRIDAMCAGVWITSERARDSDFVKPLFYLALYPYVRADDHRFDADINIINNSQYRMAVLDGGVTETIRWHLFPQARAVVLPQLTSPAELFAILAQGKADMLIYDRFTFGEFDKNNPGKLRQLSTTPVKIYPNAVPVKRGEEEFRRMLDHATDELFLTGTLDKIIDRHEKYPGTFLRVVKPYGVGE